MIRIIALPLACALVICLVTISVPAQSPSEPQTNSSQRQTDNERNAKVRADMARLVGDAKAGKVSPRNSQFPQPQRNNLSKGAKIAIVAGIVLVVLALVVIHSVRNINCESRCVL